MAGPELLLIGAITAAAGGVASGVSASRQGQFQAGIAAQNQKAEIERAAAEEQRFRSQSERDIAKARAAAGARGTTLEGSPIEILGDLAMEAELDALTIRQGGEIGARRQAIAGQTARAKGRAGLTQGILAAPGPLLSAGMGGTGTILTEGLGIA